ncbi:uncharacterized protein VTP21DRAFT_4663 [Calcarisporiella thermophila]|uniref:uncharacterized protein n=1 Tax=Calcarisporiella thermophila TaxID=911321 RepID=UPI0037447344
MESGRAHASPQHLRDSLAAFLRRAPLHYNYDFTQQRVRYEILLECYTSLWGRRDEFMHLLFPRGFEDAGGVEGILQQQQHELDFDLPADDENLPEYSPAAKGKACGHVFRRGEPVYRCRNCALDDTCVLCSRCFYASDHSGHDTVISINSGTGGCCDCGDPEAWKIPMHCPYHSSDPDASNSSDDATANLSNPASATAAQSSTDGSKLAALPSEFIDYIRTTVSTILDFVLETLTCSPDDLTQQNTVEAVRSSANKSSRFIEKISGEPEPEQTTYACVLWNDENHSFEQVIYQLLEATSCQREVARRIAENVDKRGREIVEISNDLPRLVQIANSISSVGLAVTVRAARDTFREQMSGLLIDWLRMLSCGKHRFFSNVPGSAEAFRQILCEELCREWDTVDTSCMITIGEMGPEGWDDHEGRDMSGDEEDEDMDESANEDDFNPMVVDNNTESGVPEEPTQSGVLSVLDTGSIRSCEDPRLTLRIDWLLTYDLRLWKEARGILRELYIGTLVVSPEYKKIMGIRFARNYGTLANHFLLRDREMEHSVMLFSVQLFTVPTVAYMLVSDHDFLSVVFAILQMYFTRDNVISIADVHRPVPPNAQINCDSRAFKNCRYFHIFHDLRYLVSTDAVRGIIPRNRYYLSQYLDLLTLFQGMNPNVRASDQHVEYESETWVHAFNLTLQLSRSCRHFAECFTMNTEVLSNTIRRVLQKLSGWAGMRLMGQAASEQPGFHTVAMHAGNFKVVKFSVASQPVSFHHPLHWFLAELLENVSLLDDAKLRAFGWETFRDLVLSFAELPQEDTEELGQEMALRRPVEDKLLMVVDYPIQVLVLLAQIRSTLWVRNGYGIRSQAHHYRDVSLRENTYDTDIYLLQIAFTVLDPDVLLVSLLDRFDLVSWFSGHREHRLYDHAQTVFLAEELLLLLIICMSERAKAIGMSAEEEIRREIIHGLCIQPIAYSELTRRIPERLNENPRFDEILTQLANFKPPDGMSDHGTYELRDQYYDEVNPYFVHYTRNNREESEEILKKRLKKKYPDATPLLLPRLTKIDVGPFVNIGEALHSKTMTQIIFYALWNAMDDTKITNDTLIDEALHLCVIALLDENNKASKHWHTRTGGQEGMEVEAGESGMEGFARHATMERFSVVQDIERHHISLLTLLLRCASDATYKELHPKVHWILDRLEEVGPALAKELIGDFRRALAAASASAHRPSQTELTEQERKKQEARERQARIMQQFHQAQQSFLEKHEDLYEDDEYADDTLELYSESKVKAEGDEHSEEEVLWLFPSGTCIVCKEEAKPGELYGMLGLIQPSNVLRQMPLEDADFVSEALHVSEHLDVAAAPQGIGASAEASAHTPSNLSVGSMAPPTGSSAGGVPPSQSRLQCKGFPADSHWSGTYSSSCGHFMHIRCFETYYASLEQRHGAQPTRNHPEDIERMEFICPLCKSLGNVILPIVWRGVHETYPGVLFPDTELRECIELQLGTLIDELEDVVWRGVSTGEIDPWPLSTGRTLFRNGQQGGDAASETASSPSEPEELLPIGRRARSAYPARFRQAVAQFPQILQDFLRPSGNLLNSSSADLYDEFFSSILDDQRSDHPSSLPSQTNPSLHPSEPTALLVNPADTQTVRKMYVRLAAVLFELHPKAKQNRLRNDSGAKSAELLWDLFGYTISCNEAAQRGMGVPTAGGEGGSGTVVDGLSQQITTLHRVLAQSIATYLGMMARKERRALSLKRLLTRRLRQILVERPWPRDHTDTSSSMMYGELAPLLLEDPFQVLSEVTTNPFSNVAPHHLIRLCYAAEVVRSLVGIAESVIAGHAWLRDERTRQFQVAAERRGARENEPTDRLREFIAWLLRQCGHGEETVGRFFSAPLGAYVRLVRSTTLPFLRRLVILMHARFGIQFPRAREVGISTDETEYDRLCRYLNLPTLHELCAGIRVATGARPPSSTGTPDGSTMATIIEGWCRHLLRYRQQQVGAGAAGSPLAVGKPEPISLHYPAIYQLVGLPYRLDTLFDESLKRVCKNCNWRPPDPALCLFCGTFVCSQSFCCSNEREGECNIHMKTCGGEVGLYFLVKKCALLLLHHHNGCFMNPPYLDLHGEVDLGLRRGRPQFLNLRRYDEVRKLWLQHGIPVQVARKIEQSYDLGGWTTL